MEIIIDFRFVGGMRIGESSSCSVASESRSDGGRGIGVGGEGRRWELRILIA